MGKFTTAVLLAAAVLAVAAMGAHAKKVGNYIIPIESGLVPVPSGAIPKKCNVAIVGAGAGGIYSAYRLLSGVTPKPTVCVFEMTKRLGGRIYTLRGLGDKEDMAVDLGAYRYIDGRHSLVQGLTENLLQLNYTLYDPASTQFRKIVDTKGDDLGFVTFVEELAKLSATMGMKLWYESQVTKIDRLPGATTKYAITIRTKNGVKVMNADTVIMNTPQRPTFRILSNSNIARLAPWNEALNTPFPLAASKVYLYYPDAWWVYMNRTTGSTNDLNFNNATTWNSSSLFMSPPLRGRYHDGDWKCDAAGKCHGMYMFTYASDNGGTYSRGGQGLDINPYNGVVPRYYWNLAVNPDPAKPYVVLDQLSAPGLELLTDAHKKLVDYHIRVGAPIPAQYASTLPTQAVVVVWDPQTLWTGGAWHSMRNGIFGGVVNVNYTSPELSVPVASMKPFPNEKIYIANEAFSPELGWAEGSLIMAENVVTQLGATPPTFITAARHACRLYPTYNYNTTFCFSSLNPVQGFV